MSSARIQIHEPKLNDMTTIYHLALEADWHDTIRQQQTYYPPTYEQDGFTHGTADAKKLMEVANHFYTKSEGDWLCLEMSEASLADSGVMIKYEPAAAVGNQEGTLVDSQATLFPHLYGGIHPKAVTTTYPVTRDDQGQFLAISFDQPNP